MLDMTFTALVGGGGGSLFSWCCDYWKTVPWIIIEVHSVKPELPKSSIVYLYIEDQLKKNKSWIWPNDLN